MYYEDYIMKSTESENSRITVTLCYFTKAKGLINWSILNNKSMGLIVRVADLHPIVRMKVKALLLKENCKEVRDLKIYDDEKINMHQIPSMP